MSRIRITEPCIALCDSCRYAVKRKAVGASNMYLLCTANQMGHSFFTEPMAICSSYSNMKELQLYEMKKLAWLVDNNKKNSIGFQSPDNLPLQESGSPKELENLEDKLPWQLK